MKIAWRQLFHVVIIIVLLPSQFLILYSSGGVLYRPEQLDVRRDKVWAIRRMGQNFPVAVLQMFFDRSHTESCHDGTLIVRLNLLSCCR